MVSPYDQNYMNGVNMAFKVSGIQDDRVKMQMMQQLQQQQIATQMLEQQKLKAQIDESAKKNAWMDRPVSQFMKPEMKTVPAPLPGEGQGMYQSGATIQQPTGRNIFDIPPDTPLGMATQLMNLRKDMVPDPTKYQQFKPGEPIGVETQGQPLSFITAPGEPKPEKVPKSADTEQVRAVLREELKREPTEKEVRDMQQKEKIQVAVASGAGRAEAFAKTRGVSMYDRETEGFIEMSWADINEANKAQPGRFIPSAQAVPVMQKQATLKEISTASQIARNALNGLARDFDTTQRIQFAKVLTEPNPTSSLDALIRSSVGKTLKPDQIEYMRAILNLRESSFALRNVSGMGQGSDMLRGAIAAAIPGASTFSKAEARNALDKFDIQVNVLRTGLPGKDITSTPKGNVGGGKKVIRKFVSPSTGREKLIYEDGTEEIR